MAKHRGNKASGVTPSGDGTASSAAPREVHELLCFAFQGEYYALYVRDLQEILNAHSITRVPGSVSFVIGIASMRGTMIPVVDVGARLTGISSPVNRKGRTKILIVRGPRGPIGMVVVSGMSFLTLADEPDVRKPGHLLPPGAEYIERVLRWGERFVSVIDAAKVLNFEAREG